MILSRNLVQLRGVVPFLGLHSRALVFCFIGNSVGQLSIRRPDLFANSGGSHAG